MDLYVIIFLLLVAWRTKPVKGLNEDYISVTTGKAMRGIFAIVVILHHLTQYTVGGHVFRYFANAGFLAVGIFFFFSGYGLQKKYSMDTSYEDGFLLKRIPSVLIPYLVATLVYWGGYALVGAGSSFTYMLSSIFSSHTMVANGWYVINILVFYVFFYLLMRICKRRHGFMVAGGIVFAFLWSFFCKKMGLGIWWYNATLSIGVGMFWAVYEDQILEKVKNHTTFVCLFATVAFLISFHFLGSSGSLFSGFYVPVERVVGIFFILMVLGCSMKFKVGNKVLYFIGTISYELYLIHGLWIYWFKNGAFQIENEFLLVGMVFLCGIVSAVILHKVSGYFVTAFKNLLIKQR